jgi:DNA (cytosine-5)-methyltransferase 1
MFSLQAGKQHGVAIPFDTTQVTSPGNYSSPQPGDACHPLAEGQHPSAVAYRDDRGRGNDNAVEGVTFPLHAAKGPSEQQVVAYRTSGNCGAMEQGDKTAALNCNSDPTQQIVTVPIDMRQASRGDKMTNNRPGGSSGGPPGTGIGEDGDPAPSIAETHTPAVAYQCHGSNVGEMGHLRAGNGHLTGGVPFVIGQNGSDVQVSEQPGALAASQERQTSGDVLVQPDMAVRRLTPLECARLQGFPDDYLAQVTYRGKCPPADGPMYRALGNSMAVPVMWWIGRRIMEAERESQNAE